MLAETADESPLPEVSATLDVLVKNVPKKVPGIAFLSGGQSSDLACIHLNKMNPQQLVDLNNYLSFLRLFIRRFYLAITQAILHLGLQPGSRRSQGRPT